MGGIIIGKSFDKLAKARDVKVSTKRWRDGSQTQRYCGSGTGYNKACRLFCLNIIIINVHVNFVIPAILVQSSYCQSHSMKMHGIAFVPVYSFHHARVPAATTRHRYVLVWCLNPWCPDFLKKIYKSIFAFSVIFFTLKWYFNSLWPSDAIWRQGSRSTLAQVMACCLMAPSHYLIQCWLMINEAFCHSPDSNFTENKKDVYR